MDNQTVDRPQWLDFSLPLYFLNMEINSIGPINCLVRLIFQNIFFCVLQRK